MSEKEKVVISMKTFQEGDASGFEGDSFDFVTDGEYSFSDNVGVFTYHESVVTGLAGTKTSVFVHPDKVIVEREGMMTSQMVFKEGEKCVFKYNTPYGSSAMGIDTKAIRNSFNSSGGSAEIDYILDVQHRMFLKNKLTINVEKQGETENA